MAQAALMAAGEDPTDPSLVDRVIERSARAAPLWAPRPGDKRGAGGTLYRYKVATRATDTEIAQTLEVSRQAVNYYWHSGKTTPELTRRQKDLLLQQLLLQRRRLDAVIAELGE